MKLFINTLSMLFILGLYCGSGEIELASGKLLKAILQVYLILFFEYQIKN